MLFIVVQQLKVIILWIVDENTIGIHEKGRRLEEVFNGIRGQWWWARMGVFIALWTAVGKLMPNTTNSLCSKPLRYVQLLVVLGSIVNGLET
jgi:hypothetical protein